jgi:CRP/FNR family cyclic AMP-dependent transcriptional regulator
MRPAQVQRTFAPHPFLATAGEGRKTMVFSKKQAIFVQGDRADSQAGKEATLGILSDGSFLGEGSLAGQTLRMGSATAMTECLVLRIEKKAMMQSLHRERALADMFVKFLLGRNVRYEEDLIDQLFNSSEKRLARMLLLLAQFGKEGKTEAVLSRISQETLAEMVGTTRSRVSFFMNRFRKLGFVDYNSGGLQVHNSLINVVLHD